ncbi:hypothetical protein F5Y08DRAFT_317900 [Xylaria arbuscula]|nr:hypothetical protein F5Y08DRAFT_317900 [Xylaria arbuscula]
MPIFHAVLFKLKPGVLEAQLAELKAAGEEMLGAVPGLQSFHMGPPVPSTAHRAQGFNMAIMTILDKEENLLAYAGHPAHLKVHNLRLPLCDETIVYDLEI